VAVKPFRYLVILALLMATASPGTARAEDEVGIEPWHNAFAQARYYIERGKMSDARERLEEIVDEYEFPEVLDRASALYSETYLRERRYGDAIDFMEDTLEARGDEPFEMTRRLYTATERRIRRARNRARMTVEALEERYEDISWWNVFKIFDKLGRRKDLKDAEKDLEELEDLHDRFDPRHLFPVPALTVSAEEDGVTDEDDSGDESSDEAQDSSDESDSDEASESDKAEVADEESTEEAEEASSTATEDADSTQGSEEAEEEASAEEGTAEAAASTDAEATEGDGEAETEAETASAPASGETSAASDAMNRDTAKEVLAEEIAALVALIPEDKLDQADAILGGTVEEGDEAAETETEGEGEESEEVETASASASDETSAAADTDEASEEPGDESSAEPTEGTLELMPSSPESSETSATAEVAASDEASETTAADVTSLAGLREQYYAAYQHLQQTLVSGDQDAIKAARQDYLAAVQAMQSGQAHTAGGSTADTEGPAAPSSSTTGTADAGDAAASTDAGDGATGPAAPAVTPAPAGTGVSGTTGFVRRDRAGIQRGVSDGGLRQSRGSLRR
jgi:hypothetical protein